MEQTEREEKVREGREGGKVSLANFNDAIASNLQLTTKNGRQ